MVTATDSNPKTAQGRLKPSLHAIPPSALIALGLAMENGENKYGLMNWRGNPVSSSVYYDAALRHFLSWWDGENQAADSGIHHLAHVMACCAILIDAEITATLIDDRPQGGPAASLIAHLHDQRAAAAAAGQKELAEAVDQIHALGPADPGEPDLSDSQYWAQADEYYGEGSALPNLSIWQKLFTRKKEPQMATELQTMIDAVHRSEASSEKTRQLVLGLGAKIDALRTSTTDPATAAALLSLSVELNSETDKVAAAEADGEGKLVDPAPAPVATPPVDTPPVVEQNPAPATDPIPAPAAGEDPGSPGVPVDVPPTAA